MTSVVWFRRDLRRRDHPALAAAARAGDVVPLFVLDPRLLGPAGAPRTAFLFGCLRALDRALGGALVVRRGDPAAVVRGVVDELGASEVFATTDDGPYGRVRDAAVATALASRRAPLRLVDTPYAVPPGTVLKSDGTPFQVFTAYHRAWRTRGVAPPADAPAHLSLVTGIAGDPIPGDPSTPNLPEPGEAAAEVRLGQFARRDSLEYANDRDRPDLDRTSRLSPYLKLGCIHPRQILAALGSDPGAAELARQLAWRDFYADVVHHRPESVRESMRADMARLEIDTGARADRRFAAWAAGETGYPIVDAGMRQLLTEAWLPNRVRMIVASFLVKDLHLDWRRGARWFMEHLVDGDLASNAHGWQWVAGTGTDAAPYHRIFNPVTQGRRYDPDGVYVRRHVPELGACASDAIHEPWAHGGVAGYPERIVDHATERRVALDRFARARHIVSAP
jgi:deoxyribodipyrimidine photo-lyase